MASPGRLVEVEELVLRAGVLVGVLLLSLQLGREEVRGRGDVRVYAVEADPDADHDDRGRERPELATRDRQHDEAGHEARERRAGDREHEPGEDEGGERQREAPERRDEQRDHEHVGGGERADERRDQPPEQVVVAGVEGEVLGHAARPVVVEAELVAEVADRARAVPPPHADRVLLDQAEARRRPRPCRGSSRRPTRICAPVTPTARPRKNATTGTRSWRIACRTALRPAPPSSALCGITA